MAPTCTGGSERTETTAGPSEGSPTTDPVDRLRRGSRSLGWGTHRAGGSRRPCLQRTSSLLPNGPRAVGGFCFMRVEQYTATVWIDGVRYRRSGCNGLDERHATHLRSVSTCHLRAR